MVAAHGPRNVVTLAEILAQHGAEIGSLIRPSTTSTVPANPLPERPHSQSQGARACADQPGPPMPPESGVAKSG